MTKFPQRALVAFLLVAATGTAMAEVPAWIPAPPQAGPTPIWATPDQVTTAKGELRSELFQPFQTKNIKKHLEMARAAREATGLAGKQGGEACQSWIFVPPSPVIEDMSLKGLLSHAHLAFVGTVVDRKEGFYHGYPNSLLEIRVEKVLKAPAGQGEITSIFATFPHVEMRVGIEMLCMRSDRYPEQPTPGKGIMVFTTNIPDRNPLVVAPNTEEILFETEDGGTSLPTRLGNVPNPPSWASLVQRVEELSAAAADGTESLTTGGRAFRFLDDATERRVRRQWVRGTGRV